ncbi:MAG: pyruvate kinase [Methanobacteriota archaeon]|nr:MAG: pyruvate kinase [Euryarchaeota archaeon]
MGEYIKAGIIGTIGPSSANEETLKEMFTKGLNIVRINLSHGSIDQAKKNFDLVRTVNDTIGILLDLSGPKMRIGAINGHVHLKQGQEFRITKEDVQGDEHRVGTNYPELIDLVKPGNTLYLNDGLIELVVKEKTETDVICEVVRGGILSSRKGINAPGVPIGLFSPTAKDVRDLEATISLEPDFYGVSFVRRPEDLIRVKEIIATHTKDEIHLVSKIEHQDALKNFDEILKESNEIMVARGDLGVEMNPAEVPLVQKELIKKCNRLGKPAIVATQMLESMVVSPRPTRAEASDVANAILDGADVVMLSAETATGDYPVKAVETMRDIILKVQNTIVPHKQKYLPKENPNWDAVGRAAVYLAEDLDASAILANTRSGDTSRVIAKYRPNQPIISITPNRKTFRRLNMQWGVIPIYSNKTYHDTDDMIEESIRICLEKGLITKDDLIVTVAGSLLGLPYTTNLIQYYFVKDIVKSLEAKAKFAKNYLSE